MEKVIINTDGASRGNPGPAAAAYIIYDQDDKILLQEGEFLGLTTNNAAEYSAVKKALEAVLNYLSERLPAQAEIRSDSRLVVEQLSGRFKIKDDKLKDFYQKIKPLELKIGQVFYRYVPREENKRADSLANEVLDNHKS